MSKLTPDEALSIVADGTVAQAKEILREQDKQAEESKLADEEKLRRNRRTIHTYNELLCMLLIRDLNKQIDEWKGFTYKVAPTDKGVVLELTSPSAKSYRLAFASTGLEKFDRAAVESFVVRAENTIEKDSVPQVQRIVS
jgi:hypothetical protein